MDILEKLTNRVAARLIVLAFVFLLLGGLIWGAFLSLFTSASDNS